MLEAEIWTLRQQINVLRRTAPKKLSFCAVDRMIFVGLYRLFPKILRSSSRTPLSAGIVPGSDPTGAGSRDAVVVGRLFRLKYAD
jgi:hypothetical protein